MRHGKSNGNTVVQQDFVSTRDPAMLARLVDSSYESGMSQENTREAEESHGSQTMLSKFD
jgi:hypothetical protein